MIYMVILPTIHEDNSTFFPYVSITKEYGSKTNTHLIMGFFSVLIDRVVIFLRIKLLRVMTLYITSH